LEKSQSIPCSQELDDLQTDSGQGGLNITGPELDVYLRLAWEIKLVYLGKS